MKLMPLQVMLPGALRAKYEKYAAYLIGEAAQLAPEMLQPYFEKPTKSEFSTI